MRTAMSVYERAPEQSRQLYQRYLAAMGAISRLFSESDKPYLDYRIVENLFCKCFGAENLSRSCIAVDARIGNEGIGIKTFVDNSPFQKIAEFDKRRSETDSGDVLEDACRVSELRNARLEFATDAYGIDVFTYHYILRHDGSLSVHEYPMDPVDLDSVKVTSETARGFDFEDRHNRYRFNRAKSTMFESFPLDQPKYEFGVTYIDNPEDAILKALDTMDVHPAEKKKETLTLPLFSSRDGGTVPERSGLNQWNAKGRPRDFDEIYIPYNKPLRVASAGFFPSRDVSFNLVLPNGKHMSAKVCQQDGKAIMSNPNRELGEWLLRDVLKLKRGQLVTMELLEDKGVNAIMFTKHGEGEYSADFAYIDDRCMLNISI